MRDPYQYPKLRWPVDIRIEQFENKEYLLLLCPLGISPAPLALIPAVAPVISCFEGQLSVQEITQKFAAHGLKEEIVRELIQLLDQHAFLASPKFTEIDKKVREDFRASPSRPAALAGSGYARTPNELQFEIDSYLKLAPVSPFAPKSSMVGLVAPHIDYRRGKESYGATYVHLRPETHDLYILIGTAHQYSPHIFHLTRKDFDSPLGVLKNDTEFIDTITNSYGLDRSYADEFLHRREHSLELQIPFLRRLKNAPRIAPILVGSFHHMLKPARYPEEFEPYDAFVSALTTAIAERIKRKERICFIAGLDMAHVGASFGDKPPLTTEFMAEVERRDRQYLSAISAWNKHTLFDHIAEDRDRRRICGYPSLYTLMDTLDRLKIKPQVELFDYRQAVDYQRECAVTFAGIGMYLPA